MAVYSEARFDENAGDNVGKTCFDVSVEYDDAIDQIEKYEEKQIGDNICVDAKDKKGANIPQITENIEGISKLIFVHKSGSVGCAANKENNFGCKDEGYGIFITKDEKDFAPDFVNDKRIEVNI